MAKFNPSLHPRGPNGRFTQSFARLMDAAKRALAKRARAAHRPRKPFRSPTQATSYLAGLPGGKGGKGVDLAQVTAANVTLRTGKEGPQVKALDAAMKPLPDDLTVYRRVPQSKFSGIDPKSLVGFQVHDAGFFPTTMAPAKGAPGDVQLHIAVPAGTKAAPSPTSHELVLDRGLDLAVERVDARPDGGTDMHLVAIGNGDAPEADPTGDVGGDPGGAPATALPAATGPAAGDLIDSPLPTIIDNSPEGQAAAEAARQQLAAVIDGDYGGLNVEVTRVERHFGGPEGDNPGLVARIVIRDEAGNQVGAADRAMYRDDNGDLVAYHEQLVLEPEVRGRGFASAFNARLEEYYREQGVTRVELTANVDVGGYAWASHGYDFADEDAAAGVLDRLRDRLDGLDDPQVRAQADEVLRRAASEPFGSDGYPSAHEISQLGRGEGAKAWFGRDVMLGSDWEGVRWL